MHPFIPFSHAYTFVCSGQQTLLCQARRHTTNDSADGSAQSGRSQDSSHSCSMELLGFPKTGPAAAGRGYIGSNHPFVESTHPTSSTRQRRSTVGLLRIWYVGGGHNIVMFLKNMTHMYGLHCMSFFVCVLTFIHIHVICYTEDVAEKAMEMNVIEALLFVLEITKTQTRWHVIGCLFCLSANGNLNV